MNLTQVTDLTKYQSGSSSIGATKPAPAAQSKLKKVEESSDLYEEDDFESLSRS